MAEDHGREGGEVVDGIDDEARRIGRRSLIKRSLAVGAVAWSAPVIVASVPSPAGAVTATPGCFRVRFQPNAASGSCTANPQNLSTECPPVGTPDASPGAVPTAMLDCLLVTNAAACDAADDVITFTMDGSCDCFIVAAAAERASATDSCTGFTIEGAGPASKSVTFTKSSIGANDPPWRYLELQMCCGGVSPRAATNPAVVVPIEPNFTG
jgi:hypothetical protein